MCTCVCMCVNQNGGEIREAIKMQTSLYHSKKKVNTVYILKSTNRDIIMQNKVIIT